MGKKIRVGAVSYLNTRPLIYGLERGMLKDEIDLVIDYPSKIASMLLNDNIDLGLIPVSVIPELKQHYLISDYCIGCNGEVASVCLFSEAPLQQIKKVFMDYQSRTSIELLKILIQDFWKIDVSIEPASKNYRSKINGTTAGLVIGDRSFEQRKISKYIYDLGLEWKKFTGLPFVFAAWVSNKELDKSFVKSFNEANKFGLENINEIVRANPYSLFDLKKYYKFYIDYSFDNNKKKGMALFQEKFFKFSDNKMIL